MRKLTLALLGASGALGGVAGAEEAAPGAAVELSLSYTADVMGVVDGGLSQRGRFLDNLDLIADVDLERLVDTSDEWIVTRTGIRERRVAAAHETTASMAAVASLRAIRTAGIEPDDIDLIIAARDGAACRAEW